MTHSIADNLLILYLWPQDYKHTHQPVCVCCTVYYGHFQFSKFATASKITHTDTNTWFDQSNVCLSTAHTPTVIMKW